MSVTATERSPYWFYLDSTIDCVDGDDCSGTFLDFATFFFGGKFSAANRGIDVGVLIAWILLALFGTWFCLKKFNYTNT